MKKWGVHLAIGVAVICQMGCGLSAKATAAGLEDTSGSEADQAVDCYMEFMKNQDWYDLTATCGYPRGDSRAVYAFGDCDGDRVPELHVDGGGVYRIYTIREGSVVSLREFEHSRYPCLIPLKDGGFVGSGRSEMGEDMISSTRRLPSEEDPFEKIGRAISGRDYYFYMVLDGDGGEIEDQSHTVSRDFTQTSQPAETDEAEGEEWRQRVLPYINMMKEDSLHLTWEYLFPEAEWDYLDAMEEGDGASFEENDREWEAYRRLLSGDFSFMGDMDRRSHFTSEYKLSLTEDTGRCGWRYLLLDVNGDGVKELFIRLYPGREDYADLDFHSTSRGIACFAYHDGEMKWFEHNVAQERYIPLKDGRMIFMDGVYTMVGTVNSDLDFVPERIYGDLIVDYEWHDEEWYKENLFGQTIFQVYDFYKLVEWIYKYPPSFEKEGEYYFAWDCRDGKVSEEMEELSKEEWEDIKTSLKALLIPDSEWKPASVFMPPRWFEEFAQG